VRPIKTPLKLAAAFLLALGAFTGCESTDIGGSTSVGVYYGVGLYDPWYYGGYHDDPDLIATPPPAKPERPVSPSRPERPVDPPRPEQPIAKPPPAAPRPTPMPSIPSTPRVAPRGGGRR